MKKYEKPIVIANSELFEGVYAASGDLGAPYSDGRTETGGGAVTLCQSPNRQGVFDTNLCYGCPAFNNNGCDIEKTYKPNKDYRPQWERTGKDESGNNGNGNGRGGSNGKGNGNN